MKNLFIVALLASTAIAGGVIVSSNLMSDLDKDSLVDSSAAAVISDEHQPAVAPAANGKTSQPVANKVDGVDESALRYFASRGDKVRLQAEIARLKALYPEWTPPEDPLAPVPMRDTKLDALWKLYADGQYAELRKTIAERKIAEPEWEVPSDLAASLDLAEARLRLINASDNQQYEMVVSLAAKTPDLLTCNEVDMLWRLAEAFAKLGKTDRATDGYSYILKNCTVAQDRLVTVQKALENLPYAQAQQIFAQQKTNADGSKEFAALQNDAARRFTALAAEDPELKLDPSYLNVLEALAEKDGTASDAEMLGWYYLRRDDMAAAEKWFLRAKEKADSVTISQGLALVFNGRGDYAQAENTMYRWRNETPQAGAVYFAATANLLASDPPARMPAAIAQEVMTRIADAVIREKNVTTAEQLGWYARAIGQHPTAIQWFQTALSWDNANEPAAYGLGVSLFTVNDRAGLEQVKKIWAPLSQRIADIGTVRDQYSRTVLPAPTAVPVYQQQQAYQPVQPLQQTRPAPVSREQAAMRAAPAKPAGRQAARSCSTTLAGPMPSGGQAVSHGWCLMELNRPLEAVKSFEAALNSGSAQDRSEAAYGQSLAYLRVGLVDKASVAAIKAPMSKARQKELRVAILSDRAVAAYRGGNFRETLFILEQRAQLAPPRRDLMALQAASYLKLRRLNDARIVYEALAASGDREGIRGLAAVRDMQRQ